MKQNPRGDSLNRTEESQNDRVRKMPKCQNAMVGHNGQCAQFTAHTPPNPRPPIERLPKNNTREEKNDRGCDLKTPTSRLCPLIGVMVCKPLLTYGIPLSGGKQQQQHAGEVFPWS